MIVYSVLIEFDDPRLAEAFAQWLVEVHVADICAAGALDAEITRLDAETPTLEARYHFASRESFAAYELDHAPRLRVAGLAHLPSPTTARFRRSLGEVFVARVSPQMTP